jgi:polar amino acid transport system substrate-binding protein
LPVVGGDSLQRADRAAADNYAARALHNFLMTRARPLGFQDDLDVAQQNQLTGVSAELWQEIARQMNVQSEFVIKPTVRDILEPVKSKEATLGIAAILITAEREVELDFSQPMFDAGLQILTPAQGGRSALVEAILTNLFSTTVLFYVFGVGLILLLMAHLVWLFGP